MLKNHFKTAFRLLIKNKVYTMINLLGLSMALMICFFSYLYIEDELSYDTFHPYSERTLLLSRVDYNDDVIRAEPNVLNPKIEEGISKSPIFNLPFLEQIESSIPEVESLIKVMNNYSTVIDEGEEFDEYTQYVSQNYFDYIGFELLYGNRKTLLKNLNSVVITDNLAMKYFGKTNVVGEELTIKGKPNQIYLVSGVTASKQSSVLYNNLFLRIENSGYYKGNKDNWDYNAVSALIVVDQLENKSTVSNKIRDLDIAHRGDKTVEMRREMFKLSEDNPVFEYDLDPISELYLNPSVRFSKSSSPLYSVILAGIALVILIIACINYLSISIASSAGRRSEIAIRKVVGARGLHLKGQFYAEAFLLSTVAVLLSFTLTQAFMPLFLKLADKDLSLSVIENLRLLKVGLAFGVLITFLAGGYPAQILTRFKVLTGLKGKSSSYRIQPGLIKGMVVFQFTLCLIFISTSLIMKQQFNYINNKDLGFDKEQVVYVSGLWGKAHLLKEELDKSPTLAQTSAAFGLFDNYTGYNSRVINGQEESILAIYMDDDLLSTLNLQVIDVQGIPKMDLDALTEGKQLINETLYNKIIADSTVKNKALKDVAGVIKDFHFESLQQPISNISFELTAKEQLSKVFIKLKPNQIPEGIEVIHSAYEKIMGKPLENLQFLDAYLNSKYKDSQKWKQIVNICTGFGVLIACIGLFGLTGINMANRTKEIGIRKVLGAGFTHIALLLNRQTLWLILISTLISVPISYFIMSEWLSTFAYSISISASLFLFSTLLCLSIVGITVAFHSVKSVLANPVESLRYE